LLTVAPAATAVLSDAVAIALLLLIRRTYAAFLRRRCAAIR
jgi:hypothetical protein